MSPPRNRVWYCLATVGVIAAGLASRRFPSLLPAALGKYPGDALWAVMVYLGWGVVLPKASGLRVALLAAVCCAGIEFLKLWPAPWLVELRHTTLGHLVFGHVFSWANLLAYLLGILTAFAIELVIHLRRTE